MFDSIFKHQPAQPEKVCGVEANLKQPLLNTTTQQRVDLPRGGPDARAAAGRRHPIYSEYLGPSAPRFPPVRSRIPSLNLVVQAPQEKGQPEAPPRRCSEHVHFAMEFDGLDPVEFLVRDPVAPRHPPPVVGSPGSPVISSH